MHKRISILVMMFVMALAGTAAAQDSDSDQDPDSGPLHPVPFLEATDLFWSLRENPYVPFRVGTENLLEADIFPHFILGFSSRCRDEEQPARSARWPCISVTPAIRLRMAWDRSAPVHSPSFMPRLNVQWLSYGDGEMTGFTVQAGHHSNGQTGCLFRWTNWLPWEEEGACVDDLMTSDSPTSEWLQLPFIEPDRINGNFSLNYFRFIYDRATYRLNLPGVLDAGGRLSLGVEVSPPGWMYEPMRLHYPAVRFLMSIGIAIGDAPSCNRFDVLSKGAFGRGGPSGSMQATCILSEERGLGIFVRAYVGKDQYNSSHLGRDVSRFEMGFTINHLRIFGADY